MTREADSHPHRPLRTLALAVGMPIVAILVAAVGFAWSDRGTLPGLQTPYLPVEIDAVTWDHKGVHLEGTAHYVGIEQTARGSKRPPLHLFPLLPRGDTTGRTVHVLVQSRRPPEALVDFADVVVEGIARRPGVQVSDEVVEALKKRGYTLEETCVLVREE